MKHLSKRGAWHLLRCTGRLLMQVALLLWYPVLPLLTDDELLCFRFEKKNKHTHTQKQPVSYWRYTFWLPAAIPRELSLHCYAILCAFIITFFSFILLMFSLLAVQLDKCVYGISHVYRRLHKPLSKINKRRAERGRSVYVRVRVCLRVCV